MLRLSLLEGVQVFLSLSSISGVYTLPASCPSKPQTVVHVTVGLPRWENPWSNIGRWEGSWLEVPIWNILLRRWRTRNTLYTHMSNCCCIRSSSGRCPPFCTRPSIPALPSRPSLLPPFHVSQRIKFEWSLPLIMWMFFFCSRLVFNPHHDTWYPKVL